jgi:outer membrane protein assembly factor BamB
MLRRFLVLLSALPFLLSACSLFGGEHKEPLPGERISVLSLDRRLQPDPKLADIAITLPAPVQNRDWPEAGGDPSHAIGRPALPDRLAQVWQTSVGKGSSDYTRILAQPIVADGRVYAMDGGAQVGAYDAAAGKPVWRVDLKPKGEQGNSFGGGLAFWNGHLYAATGYAEVLQLDPASGKVLWRKSISAPARAEPTVVDGRVFVVTVEDELDALSVQDGHVLWTHNGIPETAGLIGGASPAVSGEVAVVGYSSGELFALTVENGRVLWTDNLAVSRAVDAVAALADIRGRPVIDRDRVFAVGHSGRTAAIDLRTGDEAWGQEIGGSHGPWVAGDYVYVLTNDNELVCLTRNEGKVRWLRQLPSYRNEKDKSGPIKWAGPMLGGDRLVVLSSGGEAMFVSPYTGKPLGTMSLSGPAYIEPAIAGNALYVLTDDGNLTAYR